MTRKFSVWSVLGIGFTLDNTWLGVASGLITSINSGGPVLLVYGAIIIFVISLAIAVSLSELASAMPNAAGQFYWTRELAPKRYARPLSFVTGWFAWSGSIFGSASWAVSAGAAIVGCWQLMHPSFEIRSWHTFVAYQVVNAVAFLL